MLNPKQVYDPGKNEILVPWKASKRGSAIHLGCENYIRGLDPGVPEEYQDFWYGITTYLDWFDTIHWRKGHCVPTGIP